MKIELTGVSKTDTHQQEAEMIKIIAESNGNIIIGQIGTGFDSNQPRIGEIEYNFINFTGELIEEKVEHKLYQLNISNGNFSCHHFTANTLYIKFENIYAYLTDMPDYYPVKFYLGNKKIT